MSLTSYKAGIAVTSTTLADLGIRLVPGHIRYEHGKEYMLALSGGTIPDGYAAAPDISLTAAASALVFVACNATAGTSGVWCINNTGGSVATDTYFWGLVQGVGYGYVDTNGTVTGGIALCVESTAGELMERTDSINCGVALASISADATGSCYFDCKHDFLMLA